MERLHPTPEPGFRRLLAADPVVPVLLLKLVPVVLHHGSVGIIRSLGRLGVPVYGIVEDPFTPATVSRYLRGFFTWDTRELAPQQLLEGMAVIGEQLNRPTIVIPTDDAAAAFLAEQATTLRRWFVFPDQPAMLPRTLANKRELYLLCKKIGVPCPETVSPSSIDEVHEFVQHAAFPVVAKVAASWLLQDLRRTTSIAWTPDQAVALFRSAESQRSANLVFQEYIPPAFGEDWFYHGYCNRYSGCCIGFTGRKLRSYPAFAGPTTLGKAIVNEPLQRQVEDLLESISFAGIVDLDYRLDRRDGQYKLLDFNPRIGAQFRLFEDDAGVDVARALYLDLTGASVPRSRPVEGRTFVADVHDIFASVSYFRQGQLTVRDWWRSLEGTKEWAWFSRSDPLPFVMMGMRLMLRVLGRLLRIRRGPKASRGRPRYSRGIRGWAIRKNQRAIGARRHCDEVVIRGASGPPAL